MTDTIAGIVDKILRQHHAIEERALEQAVQGGEHGVSVTHLGMSIRAVVDAAVPYGHLYTFPSPEAYDRWKENGAPTQ